MTTALVTPDDPWGASQDFAAAVSHPLYAVTEADQAAFREKHGVTIPLKPAESVDFDAYMADTSPGAPITIVSQRMLPAIHFPDGTVSYGYRCTKSCGHEDDYSIADGRAMGDMVGVRADCRICGVTA